MPSVRPPTKDEFFEILRRVTPEEYHQPIIDDPRGSVALYRAFARQFSVVAERAYRSAQACFYLSSSLQGDDPASSKTFATATVSVQRTRDFDKPRVAIAGAMRLRGRRNRTFVNALETEWIPWDTENEKELLFIAEAPGFASNMDHVADPDGNLTNGVYDADAASHPPGTDYLDLDDQDGDRTSIGATIIANAATGSQIKDSGRPSMFRDQDVGLYVRIDHAANAANIGKIMRVVAFEQPDAEDPPGSGLFPRIITVDDGPQRYRLVNAQADDGGVLTNETPAANEESPDDMTLLPAVPAVGDAYYFGSATVFQEVVLEISTLAIATTLTLAWEYWNGGAYVAIPAVLDGTELGATPLGQSGRVTFTPPGDWAPDTIGGRLAYHVRLRVTAAAGVTQQPLGQQAYTMNADPLIDGFTGGLSEAGEVTWSVMDWADLGFELTHIEAPTGGRDDDLFLLGEERGVYRQTDETDEAFRRRASRLADVVSPKAIQRTVNRQLEPFGFRGLAFDISILPDADPGTYFDGFFLDVDALDYYQPGDAFPLSPYHLLLSHQEERGWFFVILPFIGDGDFGLFLDEGPKPYIDPPGEYLGPALDSGFLDGFAVGGDAAYRALYNAIDAIRGGGIGFTMIRDERLNTAFCP